MKVLFLTNIPSPYRVDFFNEFGKYVDLTVIYERHSASDRDSKWKGTKANCFNEIYLNSRCIGTDKTIGFQLIKEIKKHKFDFLVFCGYNSPSVMFAITYCRFHKIPFYIESDGGFNKKDKFPKNLLKKFLICKAKGHFVTCEEYKNYLLGLGVHEERIFKYPFSSIRKDEILSEPVSQTEKLELRKKLKMTEEKIILSVGRFAFIKGFDVLLKATVYLPSNVGIYIVGGEPTDEYLQLKDSLNLMNVHFVGFKTKTELNEYYKSADLFVLPTREDIWGLVINEALSKGLPVITTDRCIAGLELIRNGTNGYIVPVNSETVLANRIIRIFDENNGQLLGHNAIFSILNYTIENMSDAHLKFIEVNKNSN